MSPFKTFSSCGASSILKRRSVRPSLVSLGSGVADRRSRITVHASVHVLRNFHMENDSPPRPIRCCLMENWAIRVQLDKKGDCQQKRQGQKEHDSGSDNVQETLEQPRRKAAHVASVKAENFCFLGLVLVMFRTNVEQVCSGQGRVEDVKKLALDHQTEKD